jgi:hypothetical protein
MLLDIPDLENSVQEVLTDEGRRELFGSAGTPLAEDEAPRGHAATETVLAEEDDGLFGGSTAELVLDDDEEVKLGDEE